MNVTATQVGLAVLTLLGSAGAGGVLSTLLGRKFQAAAAELARKTQADKTLIEQRAQEDKVRAEMRDDRREDTRLVLDGVMARLTSAEAKSERQDAKIAALQDQVDELRSQKFALEAQLHALELLKATESVRADVAEGHLQSLRERIAVLEEQLEVANAELADRRLERRAADCDEE